MNENTFNEEARRLVIVPTERLESRLGDPSVAGNPLSHARAVALDEQDAFPEENRLALHAAGFFDYLIPIQYNGKLASHEALIALTRAVSRRDLSTAIAVGQVLLGALPVWLAGSPAQAALLADEIRAGHLGCLALTERDHGSDLMANDMRAEAQTDGWRLSGEKWLINNATRGHTLCVLAKTRSAQGRDEMSVFFLRKSDLDGARVSNHAKILTHGIRGADISGIRFDACPLPAGAMLDKPGAGFAIVLKTLQVSRILCAGFSLGAADTAIRTALGFALARKLYGATVSELPAARQTLVAAYLDLLIAESVALVAARAIDHCRAPLTLWSAITKYFVPVTCDSVIRQAAVVLGARHYLRAEPGFAHFQKLMRDAQVVALFDGSTAVNLSIVAGELNTLSPGALAAQARPEQKETLAMLCASLPPAAPPSPLRATDLELGNQGRDDVIAGLFTLPPALAAEPAVATIITAAHELRAAVEALKAKGDFRPTSAPRALLAERYTRLFAAATVCQRRAQLDTSADHDPGLADCLALMLERCAGTLNGADDRRWSQDADRVQAVWARLLHQFEAHEMFALNCLRLAEAGSVIANWTDLNEKVDESLI